MPETKDDTNKTKYSPILPFDVTVGEDFSMYQHTTYHRDISMFDNDEQMMERGNVIHSFRCNFQEARPIGGDMPVKTDTDESDTDNEVSDEAAVTEEEML
ncbi:MAG: hypothetical protein IJY09_09395 [Lachnospiraceae bacterium]|nr:hypothetical protein [Lachnospiraceae bacterium]